MDDLTHYTAYLGQTFDDLIFDIKKQVYKNNMDSHYSEASNEEELMTMLDEGAETRMSDNDLIKAIERTEVGEATYKWKYAELRDAYWKMKRNVSAQYNFGLILLDCRKFQEQCFQQVGVLLEDFRNHLIRDFTDYLTEQLEKNEVTWRKVRAVHSDIDETIGQIDYITNMQNEEVFDELK